MTNEADGSRSLYLAEQHEAYGATFQPFAGFSMPTQYTGIKDEHLAVRNGVGLFDVSHMGQLFVTGPDAIEVSNYFMTNDIASKSNRSALYTVLCNEQGGILEDTVVYRLDDETVLFCINAANRDKVDAHFRHQISDDADVTIANRSEEFVQLAIQGPDAESLLSDILEVSLEGIGRFKVETFEMGDARAFISRTGYTGEDGFELYVERGEDISAFFGRLVETGQQNYGMKLCGLGARDTLRIEAMLHLYGQDIDEETSPFEAGLSWLVKHKKSEYIGKDALERLGEHEPSRVFRSLKLDGRGMLREGYAIVDGDQKVGTITSGGWSPVFETSVGLGYLRRDLAKRNRVTVEVRGRHVEAEVSANPIYSR